MNENSPTNTIGKQTGIDLSAENIILETDSEIFELIEKLANELERRLNKVNEDAKREIWNSDSITDLNIALREIIGNAVIHGNSGLNDPSLSSAELQEKVEQMLDENPTNKKIKLEMKISQTEAFMSAEDEGQGFDPDKIPDPKLEENLLRPSGRGISILKAKFGANIKFEKLPSGMKVSIKTLAPEMEMSPDKTEN